MSGMFCELFAKDWEIKFHGRIWYYLLLGASHVGEFRRHNVMAVLIYANANSLFDFANGAARSIKLILKEIASSGVKVFAITSCVSDAPVGLKYCREIWSRENRRSPGKHPLIQRFMEDVVQHSLMYCDQYSR